METSDILLRDANKDIKIYVGCSLTHAPEEFRQEVEAFKKRLSEKFMVFDFLGLTAGSAQDVYEWDIHHCVKTCDLFVAICDHTSLGLGYEIGVAVEAFKKPVLAVAHTDIHLTRLVQGISSPLFSFERYNVLADVVGLVESKLKSLKA